MFQPRTVPQTFFYFSVSPQSLPAPPAPHSPTPGSRPTPPSRSSPHHLLSSPAPPNAPKSRGPESGGVSATTTTSSLPRRRHYHDPDRAFSRHLAELKRCQAERRQ